MHMDNDMYEGEGSGFAMGLLFGAALGAAVGMMFAPKPGNELRRQLSDAGSRARTTASDRYRRASSSVNTMVEKGRDAVHKGREAFQRTKDTSTTTGSTHPRPISTGTPGTPTSTLP